MILQCYCVSEIDTLEVSTTLCLGIFFFRSFTLNKSSQSLTRTYVEECQIRENKFQRMFSLRFGVCKVFISSQRYLGTCLYNSQNVNTAIVLIFLSDVGVNLMYEKTSYASNFALSFYSPPTHYSSLFANNDKIIFSRKNLNFAKRGKNTPTHCS